MALPVIRKTNSVYSQGFSCLSQDNYLNKIAEAFSSIFPSGSKNFSKVDTRVVPPMNNQPLHSETSQIAKPADLDIIESVRGNNKELSHLRASTIPRDQVIKIK